MITTYMVWIKLTRVTVNQLLVDASAWVALFNKDDKYNREATAFWRYVQSHRLELVTHDYIMDETYTILRRTQNGLLRATQAHQAVEQSKWIQFVEVSQEYRERGRLLQVHYGWRLALPFRGGIGYRQ